MENYFEQIHYGKIGWTPTSPHPSPFTPSPFPILINFWYLRGTELQFATCFIRACVREYFVITESWNGLGWKRY